MTIYVGVICENAQQVIKAYDMLAQAGYKKAHVRCVEELLAAVIPELIEKDRTVAVGIDRYLDILGIFNLGEDYGDVVATFDNLIELANQHFPLQGE